ncbi:Protein of unknown function [Pyronema omphalodes CBS 100304]|uniref:Uncharacterized protein n=1 Tax=Pyronema omphalodes (strain CBS 100304) TaxID=1076935 RepID=U4LT53_PYROM|nr:Protein of unknown function [Pyronema omphalodes CBS 100304]
MSEFARLTLQLSQHHVSIVQLHLIPQTRSSALNTRISLQPEASLHEISLSSTS